MSGRLEVLAMLNANTANWDRLPGGVQTNIAADVSAAMAKSTEFEWAFTMMMVGENPSFDQVLACSAIRPNRSKQPDDIVSTLRELHYHMGDVALEQASARGWQYKSEVTLRRVAELALAECLGSGKCKKCKGQKSVTIANVVKTCRSCNGVGNRTLSNSQRARLVGLCEESYRRYWQTKHQVLVNYCTDAVRAVESRLSFELGN